jgi:O-antigen/teichoic acid export membrane protein
LNIPECFIILKISINEIILFDKIIYQFKNPLFRNSFFIILTSISAAGFGFIFWLIAAKLYSPGDVGIATALFSSICFLVLLSQLGFDQSLIRFFPNGKKNEIFYSSLIVIVIATVFLGILFLIGVQMWSPNLSIIYSIYPFYFAILVSYAIFIISGNVFIALRYGNYFLYQNLFIGIRIFFLFPFVFLGVLGIFYSIGIAYLLALFFPILIIYRLRLRISGINFDYLKESLNFSAGNYFINLFLSIPSVLLPIFVLSILGDEQAAVFYITYSISALLFIIPTAFGISLFVEGSHGYLSKKTVIKSCLGMLSLIFPLIFILLLFGNTILGLIGSKYIEGYTLLSIIIFSSLGVVIFNLFSSIKKVQKKIQLLIFFSILNGLLLVCLSIFLLSRFGIVGIGYAYIIGYGLVGVLITPILYRDIKNLP